MKAIEESKPNIIEQICSLLKYLYDSGIITTDQLKNVFCYNFFLLFQLLTVLLF